jgi:predicted small metal-binding protein
MKKHLTCRALGMKCGFEVHDESEDEITVTIGDHLKRVHGVEFTDVLRRKARDLILLDPA